MSEKEIKKLTALAVKKSKESISKEDAIRSLQQAGILDAQGNHTAHYQILGKAVGEKPGH
jgi:hypothetical protein